MWLIFNYGAQTHKDKKKLLVTKIQIMYIFRFNDDLHNEILQFFTFFFYLHWANQKKLFTTVYDLIFLSYMLLEPS